MAGDRPWLEPGLALGWFCPSCKHNRFLSLLTHYHFNNSEPHKHGKEKKTNSTMQLEDASDNGSGSGSEVEIGHVGSGVPL